MQVGLLTLVCPTDLTRSAVEERHRSFPSFIIIIIMAYNREWDMGKETWHDGGSWSGNGRDEDYGEAKKRKFNGGVRQLLSSSLR
jgi:hypothetical protein